LHNDAISQKIDFNNRKANDMFEVLVFMFENYIAHHALPDNEIMTQELAAAGFEQSDISGAVHWFHELKFLLNETPAQYSLKQTGTRIFTDAERRKISTESFSFILFLQQAKVLNDVEFDLIIDRAMALKQKQINIEEIRWITMLALWNEGREKDYLFVEDALFNPRGLNLH
jgi:Smg protein